MQSKGRTLGLALGKWTYPRLRGKQRLLGCRVISGATLSTLLFVKSWVALCALGVFLTQIPLSHPIAAVLRVTSTGAQGLLWCNAPASSPWVWGESAPQPSWAWHLLPVPCSKSPALWYLIPLAVLSSPHSLSFKELLLCIICGRFLSAPFPNTRSILGTSG